MQFSSANLRNWFKGVQLFQIFVEVGLFVQAHEGVQRREEVEVDVEDEVVHLIQLKREGSSLPLMWSNGQSCSSYQTVQKDQVWALFLEKKSPEAKTSWISISSRFSAVVMDSLLRPPSAVNCFTCSLTVSNCSAKSLLLVASSRRTTISLMVLTLSTTINPQISQLYGYFQMLSSSIQ